MADRHPCVILEWIPQLPGLPRYSFATIKHAEELWPHVKWLQRCPSLEVAAETVTQLNFRDAATGRGLGDGEWV